MFQNEREMEILKLLSSDRYLTVKTMSKILYTSESSIRRALNSLELRGYVKRSYGGATLIESSTNIIPFITRVHNNVESKQIIAKKAITLVKRGDIIFLDQSTSSFFIAQELINKKDVTVITNNIEILSFLSQSSLVVFSSGGKISPNNKNCLIGTDAQRIFKNFRSNILFFSAHSLSNDGTIYDCDREEVCIRNVMLENSNSKVFLCDKSKFNTLSPCVQTTIDNIDYIVSDTTIPNQLMKNNIHIL